MNKEAILLFLKELRDSSDRIYQTFTEGSCVRLFKMLHIINPEAELYWSDGDNHSITKIKDVYYDIGGEVVEIYVKQREYHLVPKKNWSGYFLMKYSELEDIKNKVVVEKYFKP